MSSVPRVSVVVPSFNQARFLRACLDSILEQDHADLEVLVMDGGSHDESLAILESFGDRIRFVSEPDRGQSHALNRGFARATGEIVAWLNSDDRYAPGAVKAAVAALQAYPEATMAYGEGEIIDEEGRVLGPFIHTQPFDLWTLVHLSDFILQPTVFMRAAALREAGGVDESLHFGMDWDLWIRLACRGPVVHVRQTLAQTREYATTKTSTGGWRRLREIRSIMARHGAGRWPPGARSYGLDTLRHIAPTVFGPSSLADRQRLRGRLLPRLFRPLHELTSWLVGRQTSPFPGAWGDGWMGPRAYRALPWGGEAGTIEVEMEVPAAPALFPLRLEATTEGARGEASAREAGTLHLSLRVPGAGGKPRPLEVSFRSSRAARIGDDPRMLSGRLRRLEFRPDPPGSL